MALPPPSEEATVLVTGASSGIGAMLARRLSDSGRHVTLVARRRPLLDELASTLPHAATVEPCDLVDEQARAALIEKLLDGDRRVVGVCNSAGRGRLGPVTSDVRATEQEIIRLNALALHDVTTAFLDGMTERGEGAILNVASSVGFQPVPRFTTYAATKAFVISFSQALDAELRGSGVSVTVVAPGPISGDFAEIAGFAPSYGTVPVWLTDTPEAVARAAIAAMEKGRRMVVPSVATKVAVTAAGLTPRRILIPALARFMRTADL